MHDNLIEGPDALRAFRKKWTGDRVLNLVLNSDFPVLINWAVGVGKSYNLDEVIEAAINSGHHDLVLVLLPRREVQKERRWVKQPPSGLKVVDLRPRPSEMCGLSLNQEWSVFEVRGLSTLGRRLLCSRCRNKKECFWIRQYGKALAGSRVIYASQAHLERDFRFIPRLKEWAEAKNVLVLVDETNFVTKNRKIIIEHDEIKRFSKVLELLSQSNPFHKDKVNLVKLLMVANTSDLRRPTWSYQSLNYDDAYQLQKQGHLRHRGQFRNIENDLDLFCRSTLKTREKHQNGAVSFSAAPDLSADMMIYSGTIVPELLEYRLRRKVKNPFSDYKFTHPDTHWYNISNLIGTARYFRAHAPQILDFFSTLIARKMGEGKRCLLIAKKDFLGPCADGIEQALARHDKRDIKVVRGDWDSVDLSDSNIIPLINYGVIGINLFQEFDCAYCLTSYYVDLDAVDNILQDALASDQKIPIEIGFEKNPMRRIAHAANYWDRYTNVNEVALLALKEQELNVVMQAVGRVRPYTKPREVITFQCDVIPEVPKEHNFQNLKEAREHFGVHTRKAAQRLATQEMVQEAKKMGLTQRQTADRIEMSLRTVQRYW